MISAGTLIIFRVDAEQSNGSTCRAMPSSSMLHEERSGGTDFVWLKLDKTFYPPGKNGVAFQKSHEHNADDLAIPEDGVGFPSAGLPIKLVLDRLPVNYPLSGGTIACAPNPAGTLEFDDSDAYYVLTYTVE
jgi:hypothetical protein